jgi:predicted transport protein
MVKKTPPPEEQSPFKEDVAIDLSNAWLINDNTLEPQPERYISPEERKFKSEKEFTDLITANTGLLFGKNTILIDATKSQLECYVLIDYTDPDEHLIHLVDISLSKENFWQVFARVSKLFTMLTASNYNFQFAQLLAYIIAENKELYDEVVILSGFEEQVVEEGEEKEQADIEGYLQYLFNRKPFIMLVSDEERKEINEMRQTYPTNWGKSTVSVVMQKFTDEGVMYFLASPMYSQIEWGYGKSVVEVKTLPVNEKEKLKKSTEEDHLNGTQPVVQEMYKRIKAELLQEDAGLEFNPKSYYIAMRKGKNLALFHIKKKLISVVVMYAEKDTRKLIKHQEVKTLAESVQKFWNGECCTVVINKAEHLDEVILLLKKLIK